jgi:DNA double-strand break repair helicase HerA and related ATPase
MSDTADPGHASLSEQAQQIEAGYTFDGPDLDLGRLMENGAVAPVTIKILLGMLSRHGLVAGATGTGKTKTLQLMAEQLSHDGVPVFAADIKGDLSGMASPGVPNDKLVERTKELGQDYTPTAFPVEFYALGGQGRGVPVRATMKSFGPTLLAKVLQLNDTQESSLGLVFHYAEQSGLELVNVADLRAVVGWLVSDDGKSDLKELGGLSSATAGVILRNLIALSDQGADAFFGEPEFDTNDLLRLSGDRGVVSMVELPNLQDRPLIFSTFLMWLLGRLFRELPEVGDIDKPKLVFFFDEAHLLFEDASDAFLDVIEQTVRLIRSKGVGVFFVTQSPTDVPDEVLAQLGSRVQHQLRAHTPDDAEALRKTVRTYPTSAYDLEQVLTQLGIGEAIVTVMNEKGAPTPVAWTRMRAPESLMDVSPESVFDQVIAASPVAGKYATAVDRESAAEKLRIKTEALAKQKADADAAAESAKADKEAARDAEKSARRRPRSRSRSSSRSGGQDDDVLDQISKSAAVRDFARTAGRELIKSIFGRRR